MKLQVIKHTSSNNFIVIDSTFLMSLISSLDTKTLKLYLFLYNHSSDRVWNISKAILGKKLHLSNSELNECFLSLRDHHLLTHSSADVYSLYTQK